MHVDRRLRCNPFFYRAVRLRRPLPAFPSPPGTGNSMERESQPTADKKEEEEEVRAFPSASQHFLFAQRNKQQKVGREREKTRGEAPPPQPPIFFPVSVSLSLRCCGKCDNSPCFVRCG